MSRPNIYQVIVGVLLGLAPTSTARAQASAAETASPPADVTAGDACMPSCRAGFVCVRGACVSACNPPCSAGQACQEGECVSTAPPPAAPPPAVAPPAAQPAGPPAGGWVQPTLGAPPRPGGHDAEWRAERRRVRRQGKLLGYLFGGYGLITSAESDGLLLIDETDDEVRTPRFGLAVGYRQNFAYIIGLQARAFVEGMPASGELAENDGASFGERTPVDGFGVRFGVDGTLRFGPFAQVFPMYFGVGGVFSVTHVGASSEEVDWSATVVSAGALGELGVVLGSAEQLEVGIRFAYELDGSLHFHAGLGYAFAIFGE